MPRLVWLRDHMQYSDSLAQWLLRQFAYEFIEQPLADWQREFAEGQGNGDWQCLIALENGQLLGGAALATNDLPERPELGPENVRLMSRVMGEVDTRRRSRYGARYFHNL